MDKPSSIKLHTSPMPTRHRFRAEWHNYNCGTYFVTICCKDKFQFLEHIDQTNMHLSPAGIIANQQIIELPKHFANADLLNYVVMPNHLHLLLTIFATNKNEFSTTASIGCLKHKMHDEPTVDFHHNSSLSIMIRSLKGGIKRECNRTGISLEWQPRYHEHIIRNQQSFDQITSYIDNNAGNWKKDCFYR